jgi:hypothetical protein
MKPKTKYYGVCVVTGKVILLGEFDNPDEASAVAYETNGFFHYTPINESDLLELRRNITRCVFP